MSNHYREDRKDSDETTFYHHPGDHLITGSSLLLNMGAGGVDPQWPVLVHVGLFSGDYRAVTSIGSVGKATILTIPAFDQLGDQAGCWEQWAQERDAASRSARQALDKRLSTWKPRR